MNTTALKIVRKHFCSDLVPREINRANMRRWAYIVRLAGDKLLLSKPVGRTQ